jgi:ABC-type transport system involved in multi-copper enzyme maturation permease subunit
MTQTIALIVDAYRELNAKKMFWITLALSLLVVIAIACVDLNERGIVLLVWTLDAPVNTTTIPKEVFFKQLFINFGLGIWLTWIATILGLVSTSSMFPDFISGGSIELALSKPISRARLFITKYVLGLAFMALQVTVFTTASFFVLGFRGGVWEPGLFLAIPIVTLFFSFLFCVSVLLGLLTRSTIAALLLTILFWFLLFLLNTSDAVLLQPVLDQRQRMEQAQLNIETGERLVATLEEQRPAVEAAATAENARPSEREELERLDSRIRAAEGRIERNIEFKQEAEEGIETWQRWHNLVVGIKTPLPKTGETIGLLERWLISAAQLDQITANAAVDDDDAAEASAGDVSGDDLSEETVIETSGERQQRMMQEEYRSRSVAWVLGTSIGFELFILLIAGWIFARRDF